VQQGCVKCSRDVASAEVARMASVAASMERTSAAVASRMASRAVSRDMASAAGIWQVQQAVLWNRNYFLRSRFRLLKSYGSGSDFEKVMVPVPVPTLEKLRFRFQLHI
jgi:hypothetical protein